MSDDRVAEALTGKTVADSVRDSLWTQGSTDPLLASVAMALARRLDDPETTAAGAAAAARELRLVVVAARGSVTPAPVAEGEQADEGDGRPVVTNRLAQIRRERERAASSGTG